MHYHSRLVTLRVGLEDIASLLGGIVELLLLQRLADGLELGLGGRRRAAGFLWPGHFYVTGMPISEKHREVERLNSKVSSRAELLPAVRPMH